MVEQVERDDLICIHNQALGWIGSRLAGISLEFGPTDYPEDGGRKFWNYLYGFPHSYFDTMRYYILEDPGDNWAVLNGEKALRLQFAQLVKITGASHLLVEARKLHCAEISPRSPVLKNTLDWLTNTYEFDAEAAGRWFTLITRIKDFQLFWSEALKLFFGEVAYATSTDVNNSAVANSWRGLALMADLAQTSSVADNPSGWAATCEEHFNYFTHR